MVKFEADFNKAIKDLDRTQRKQIPFAISQAINDTAHKSTLNLQKGARIHLDRPTPFTLKGFKFRRSTKRNLSATVYVAPIQNKYLRYQIEGGTRKAGVEGGVSVPVNVKLNKYGNIPGKRTGLAKSKKKFIATRRGVKGVWQTTGGKKNPQIRLSVYLAKSATYKKIFPFHNIVRTTVARSLGIAFKKRLRLALATAR